MPEQELSHVTTARPKMNRGKRLRKKKRKGLRKGFETETLATESAAPSSHSKTPSEVKSTGNASPGPPPSKNQKGFRVSVVQQHMVPLEVLNFEKATPENINGVLGKMGNCLTALTQARALVEASHANLKIEVGLMRQRAYKFEEEFGHRSSAVVAEVGETKGSVGNVYLEGIVHCMGSKQNWKTRYCILTSRTLEIYKKEKDAKDKQKPADVFDLAKTNVSQLSNAFGTEMKCIQLSSNTTGGSKNFTFHLKNVTDNQAWLSSVSNRCLLCGYEDRCRLVNTVPSKDIVDFLSRGHTSTAVTLDVSGQPLDVQAAGIISRCLSDSSKPSSPISELRLVDCKMTAIKMNDVCVGLFKNSTVTKLDLSKSSMTLGMVQGLAKALEENKKNNGALVELHLNECSFEEKAHLRLVEGFKKSGLTSVSIQRCGVGDDFATALAELLTPDGDVEDLTSIDLSGNKIGDDGAVSLSKTLQKNVLLKVLSLKDNKVGDKGGVELAEALKGNSKLDSFYFEGNPVTEETLSAFTEAAQVNKHLRNLSYGSNHLNQQHLSVMQLLREHKFADAE